MRRLLSFGIPILFLVLIVSSFIGFYMLGSDDQSALEKTRDIVIIWIGFLWVIAVLLLAVVAGLMVWLALTLKTKIIPIMETLADTANRVKGTAEFMTEEVAAPLISFDCTVANARAMTRTVTGRDRKSGSTISKLLKR